MSQSQSIPEWRVKQNVMDWRKRNAPFLAHNPKAPVKPEPVAEADPKIISHYLAKQPLTQSLPL